MNSENIRQKFLDFFISKGHKFVPSSSIVNNEDSTLMFTNAGMNQFKNILIGKNEIIFPRVTNSQKCLRVSGKHNDIEEVGYDTYHHTMFEMLGSWSFGDYSHKEAIEYAWELLTQVYNIDSNLLYVTVFNGEDNIPKDIKSENEWKKYTNNILFYGKECNFWEMGTVGPCGTCTEIHIDLRSEEDRLNIPAKDLVNTGHPEVIELWNLVFIEYDRKEDNYLVELELKSVDTGMGFERLCMVLQNKKSSYETDIWNPLFNHFNIENSEINNISLRIICDHIRAISFSIADGQSPSNKGAGYVIRKLLRRASLYGYKYLKYETPFLYNLVDILSEQFKNIYPEIFNKRDYIKDIIKQEEILFLSKIKSGIKLFEKYIKTNEGDIISGDFAFKLYDSLGFNLELTVLLAKEYNRIVDIDRYNILMNEQKERSKNFIKNVN